MTIALVLLVGATLIPSILPVYPFITAPRWITPVIEQLLVLPIGFVFIFLGVSIANRLTLYMEKRKVCALQ